MLGPPPWASTFPPTNAKVVTLRSKELGLNLLEMSVSVVTRRCVEGGVSAIQVSPLSLFNCNNRLH